MYFKHKNFIAVALFSVSLIVSPIILAQENANTDHGIFTPKDIKWQKAPDSLPKGAEIAVLEGDPAASGPFTIRLKFPANYQVLPHWHPGTEHVTVISGDFYLGMGDQLDQKKMTKMPAGSFAFMAPETHHFASTKGQTVIQLNGVGPWGITYINEKDDPRNAKS